MVRNKVIGVDSHVPKLFCKPVSHAASRLTDVSRRVERAGDANDDIAESISQRVVHMIWTMMCVCQNDSVTYLGEIAAARRKLDNVKGGRRHYGIYCEPLNCASFVLFQGGNAVLDKVCKVE